MILAGRMNQGGRVEVNSILLGVAVAVFGLGIYVSVAQEYWISSGLFTFAGVLVWAGLEG